MTLLQNKQERLAKKRRRTNTLAYFTAVSVTRIVKTFIYHLCKISYSVWLKNDDARTQNYAAAIAIYCKIKY